ncbi:MAG: hypothetical protein IPP55_02670 [Anaerolineales bacterium]|nr:hypothetical protein [Anaerolineales bacterium]
MNRKEIITVSLVSIAVILLLDLLTNSLDTTPQRLGFCLLHLPWQRMGSTLNRLQPIRIPLLDTRTRKSVVSNRSFHRKRI